MTDRVLEIRLKAARPELLQLLAQPELGLVHRGDGAGPFRLERQDKVVQLSRDVATPDEEATRSEQLQLRTAPARAAVSEFAAGKADLVIGGTFADLPFARAARVRRALQFDPASGLFGLVPARAGGLLAKPEVRRLLSEAIDRDLLVAALAVPGLAPRATVLEPGLADIPNPARYRGSPPRWRHAAPPSPPPPSACSATSR